MRAKKPHPFISVNHPLPRVPWLAQLAPVLALGLFLPKPSSGSDAVVTFNEIHYHPASAQEAEWIELHNQMSIRVDLSGWRLTGGIQFEFPEGTVVEPGSFTVVQGAGNPLENALGPFDGQLDNGGETISLRDRNHRLMDQLAYRDDRAWPPGPDGSGITLSKRRPPIATAEVGSWTSSLQVGGTPGGANINMAPQGDLLLSEVGTGFAELHYRGAAALTLNGYELRLRGGTTVSLDEKTVSPGAYLVLEDMLIESGEPLFLFDDQGHLLDAVRVRERDRGRMENDLAWHFTERRTPGSPNLVNLQEAVVINEIMYHFPPLFDDPDTVVNDYTERAEEWVELYNRSDSAVDLSGWTIEGGIRFEFPPQSTLPPDGYLVIARDAAALKAKYPDITVLGEFAGKLSNRSDTISLLDAKGNLADTVRYYDSGRWPRFADGGGSSLELRDPWADNAIPESWAGSREEEKSEWVDIHYEGRGNEPVRSNNPSNFHEFLMGLLGAGEALVDDVSVIEDPGGAAVELMKNGDFQRMNVFSGEVTDWRMLGTHAASEVEADPAISPKSYRLRLRADGAIEHTYNNVSSTFLTGHKLDAQQTYAISLRAKWVAGSPLLNTRLYLNRLGRSHVLPIPEQLGTPGRANGASAGGNIGPTISRLQVTPLAPVADDDVTISVEATDHQGVAALALWHRSAGGEWQSAPMTLTEGQDRYSGRIPPQANGTLVQFYVEATDGENATSAFPAAARDSRALLRFGPPRTGESPVSHVRLLMLPEEHAAMRRAEHAVSNGRIGGTLVANGEDYHFDVGIRLRSSPYGRRSNRMGFNVSFGKEHPYRGVHDSIAIDRGSVMPNGTSNGHFEVKVGAGVNELVLNQIAQRARGIPTTYEDVIYVETPNVSESSLAQLRMARYGAIYLDSQYEDGARGATHKFELIYHPTSTVDGRSDGLKGPYSTVRGIDIQDMRDDKEAYRFNFIPTNNRDRDDFTGIIRLGDAFSSRTDTLRRELIPQAIDVDQWMRAFAFQSLIGVADTYNMGLEHNLVLYTRPSDGRVLAFPWDLDHAFYYSPNANLLGRGNTNLARFINLPENKRLFYGHLNDIIETAFNTDAMAPWIAHLDEITGNSHYDQRFLDYIEARGNFVASRLKNEVSSLFQITTNRGNGFETDAPSVLIEGQGWIDIRNIRNEATGEFLDLTWTDINVWQAELPLTLGENVFTLQAIDFQGRELGSFFTPGNDTITVTHTGAVEAAAAGNLIIAEIHYHPEDDSLDSEFLELQNVGPHPIDLTGIRFTRGLTWEHSPDPDTGPTVLSPGEITLLVRDRTAFEVVYGEGLPILGTYGDTKLSNGGETLRLEDRAGGLIQEFRYRDALPWPEKADGGGYSLVFRNGDPQDPFAWRASLESAGTPGQDEAEPHADPVPLDVYAFGGQTPLVVNDSGELTLRLRSAADDVAWTLETSQDLISWEDAGESLELVARDRDPATDFSISTWKPTEELGQFYRIRYRLNPKLFAP